MPWGLWSYPPPGGADDASSSASKPNSNENKINSLTKTTVTPPAPAPPVEPLQPPPRQPKVPLDYLYPEKPRDKDERISWNDSFQNAYKKPSDLFLQFSVVFGTIIIFGFWKSHLRRIAKTGNIDESFYRRRKLLGQVTHVGDGDNFRMFHTPGGRLAGWGWARKVPTAKQELKGRTVG